MSFVLLHTICQVKTNLLHLVCCVCVQVWASLAENPAFPSDREACFRWFAKVGLDVWLSYCMAVWLSCPAVWLSCPTVWLCGCPVLLCGCPVLLCGCPVLLCGCPVLLCGCPVLLCDCPVLLCGCPVASYPGPRPASRHLQYR